MEKSTFVLLDTIEVKDQVRCPTILAKTLAVDLTEALQNFRNNILEIRNFTINGKIIGQMSSDEICPGTFQGEFDQQRLKGIIQVVSLDLVEFEV